MLYGRQRTPRRYRPATVPILTGPASLASRAGRKYAEKQQHQHSRLRNRGDPSPRVSFQRFGKTSGSAVFSVQDRRDSGGPRAVDSRARSLLNSFPTSNIKHWSLFWLPAIFCSPRFRQKSSRGLPYPTEWRMASVDCSLVPKRIIRVSIWPPKRP